MTWDSSDRRQELPPNWEQLRRETLERYHYKCAKCGAYANEVDHAVDPLDNHPDNLRPLCRYHHMKKTQAESAEARRRQRAKLRLDGGVTRRHPGLK